MEDKTNFFENILDKWIEAYLAKEMNESAFEILILMRFYWNEGYFTYPEKVMDMLFNCISKKHLSAKEKQGINKEMKDIGITKNNSDIKPDAKNEIIEECEEKILDIMQLKRSG